MAQTSKLRLERRRFIRRRTCLDAVCVSLAGSSQGVIRNLSVAGSFFESSACLPEGTKVRLGFPLPENPERKDWVDGRVVHVLRGRAAAEPQGPVGGMGIALTPTAEQRDRLETLLERSGAPASAREPSAPRSPSRPSLGPGVCTDEALVRLDQLRPGQTRSLRLRLVAIGEAGKTPTEFFLELKVTSPLAIDRWDACAKADFGERIPGAATLTVLKDRYETGPSLPLVESGRCIEQEFALPVDPGVEKIVFWVVTDGEEGVPERMACAIRLQPATAESAEDDLDTIRLPSVKAAFGRHLAHVLRQSPDPSLATLGGLMQSATLDQKLIRLRWLVETDADLRLVEAGVRDLELWERTAGGFGRVDLDSFAQDDRVGQALLLFHARSAPRRLAEALAAGFRKHVAAQHPDEARSWRRLTCVAAAALARRDRRLLDETVRAAQPAVDAATFARLEALVQAASRAAKPTPVEASTVIGDYVRDITGRGRRKPIEAAAEFMAATGFIALTARLE